MGDLTEEQKFLADHATRLVEIINESLPLSYNSKVPETKVSRLALAKEKLKELKDLVERASFIKLTALEAVERSIAQMEEEYGAAGIFAAAPVDRREDLIQIDPAIPITYWLFSATMQLRTPLRVLEAHGTVHEGRDPPAQTTSMHEGIWIPGFGRPRPLTGTMASDIGPIPADGGGYLSFLKTIRQIVEPRDGTVLDRRARLLDEVSKPAWADIVLRLGGAQRIANRFFPPFISIIKSLSDSAREELQRRGLTTPSAIAAAPDSSLLSIKGVGRARLETIRQYCELPVDSDAEFVDAVER